MKSTWSTRGKENFKLLPLSGVTCIYDMLMSSRGFNMGWEICLLSLHIWIIPQTNCWEQLTAQESSPVDYELHRGISDQVLHPSVANTQVTKLLSLRAHIATPNLGWLWKLRVCKSWLGSLLLAELRCMDQPLVQFKKQWAFFSSIPISAKRPMHRLDATLEYSTLGGVQLVCNVWWHPESPIQQSETFHVSLWH